MKKRTFTPTPDLLEGRIALSGGPQFTASGAAILTRHVLNQTYAQIYGAFANFAQHGQNYRALEVNLANAVSSIPWHRRDGLLKMVETAPGQLKTYITWGVQKPVITEMQRTEALVTNFVDSEVATDAIAVR
jgi:hypothetical protein